MSTSPLLNRPIPVPDDLTRPFWDATARQRLVLQRCDDCNHFTYPPQPLCDRCASTALTWQPVSGNGRVYTYTINHQKSVAGFEQAVPYINIVVELDEQPMLLVVTDLAGIADATVQIGDRVHVTFVPIGDGMMLPHFVPEAAGSG